MPLPLLFEYLCMKQMCDALPVWCKQFSNCKHVRMVYWWCKHVCDMMQRPEELKSHHYCSHSRQLHSIKSQWDQYLTVVYVKQSAVWPTRVLQSSMRSCCSVTSPTSLCSPSWPNSHLRSWMDHHHHMLFAIDGQKGDHTVTDFLNACALVLLFNTCGRIISSFSRLYDCCADSLYATECAVCLFCSWVRDCEWWCVQLVRTGAWHRLTMTSYHLECYDCFNMGE